MKMYVANETPSVEIHARLAAAEQMLRSSPPEISETEAGHIVLQHYGRSVTATLLSGERDRNFLISDTSGWSALLKFYNPVDDAPARALQNDALLHIKAQDPACPAPEIYSSRDGRQEIILRRNGTELAAVMFTRLAGVNPAQDDIGPELRANIGQVAGRLSSALAGYDHPRADRMILWDMMLVTELLPLAALIEDHTKRRSIEKWIGHFATKAQLAAASLPCQMIHNDLSLSNILVDPAHRSRVVGIIDFGDIVRAPRINEFAIAASYFIDSTGDLAVAMAQILKGNDCGPDLTPAEIALLPTLIQARLVTRILLTGWRAQLFPGNHAYITRSSHAAWHLWERFYRENPEELAMRVMSLVCGGADVR